MLTIHNYDLYFPLSPPPSQMQALLDQHSTRLTITQSTYESIETAAKSHERLQYIHCIAYPAQYVCYLQCI